MTTDQEAFKLKQLLYEALLRSNNIAQPLLLVELIDDLINAKIKAAIQQLKQQLPETQR